MFLLFEENKIGVPGFEQTIKPILMALQEHGGRASIAELNKATLRIMNLPEEVLKIMHKGSNRQSEMEYRIAWGRTYLKKYGLITNVARGIWALTDKFDGDIEKIDVNEILRQVRSESAESKEERTELTGFESALAFENMVGALLQELANKEGKRTEVTDSELSDLGYDMLLPDGLEGNQEEIKCMIKYVNDSKQNVSSFYNRVTQSLDDSFVTGKVLLITNVVVPDKIRNHFGPNIMIWDMNDLLERIEPEASYAQYLINPRQALIKDVISTDNSDQQKSYEREKYLKKIKSAFRNQDMVLFLGAGVSIDGGIPLWETLIKTLHVYMLNRLTKEKELSFEEQELIKELASDNEMESPLMQMRYIKAAFSNEEYYKLVHSALYSQSINIDTSLLNAIAKISTPQRSYCGIKSIITYNFDDLLERKFAQKDIQYNIISDERERQLVDKLNIYHVHGYLPSDFSDIAEDPNLIFSEEDYHRIYRDAYSWSNLTQLNALRENTCLFIGCSLTDPNLRRLLDVAARNGESPRHYAFLKKKKMKRKKNGEMVNKDILRLYQTIDDNIQTAYYKNLGLNIIWIDDFEEIPQILNGFLE
ncbi:MAG: hypothetical protein HFJ10_00230 [Lachnospiraceae bacterium]|nr:hypothetical protein [Lachnospiraceae bacterium]